MSQVKIIVEKHPDGYVAYPLGLKGIVLDKETLTKRIFRMRNQQFVFTSRLFVGRFSRLNHQFLKHSLPRQELKFDEKVPH